MMKAIDLATEFPTCNSCLFFAEEDNHCRRQNPQYKGTYPWPVVKSYHWCGEGLWFVINQINGEKGISYSKALELIRKEALLSEEPKKEWMY